MINKPQHFGNLTNKSDYGPLENGEVLKELQRINPQVDAKGSRKQRLHQFFKKRYGLEKLCAQRQEVLTMLKLFDNINDFKTLYEKQFGPLDWQHTIFTDFFKKIRAAILGKKDIFSDEAGCFTFENSQNVSKYFTICTMTTSDLSVVTGLVKLRR